MANRWWETTCPACGEDKRIDHDMADEALRYCRHCKFEWSIGLPEWELIVLAVAHNRKAIRGGEG